MDGRTQPSCGACQHRFPWQICGLPQSPYFNQKIELAYFCDYFSKSAAYGYFTSGLSSAIESPSALLNSILDLETAIRLGLSGDDEAHARSILGLRYEAVATWEKQLKWMRFQMSSTKYFRQNPGFESQ